MKYSIRQRAKLMAMFINLCSTFAKNEEKFEKNVDAHYRMSRINKLVEDIVLDDELVGSHNLKINSFAELTRIRYDKLLT